MQWALKPFDEAAARELARSVGLHPVAAQLLVQRGITSADQAAAFLHPSLSQLHDPYLMRGMRVAIERLAAAIARGERVLIYGDYDVDGTLAVVILKTAIELCGGAAEFHVPHRIREGYGMRDEVIERAAAEGVRLIISVDVGIRAFAAAEAAERAGVDLIVTDHHLPAGNSLPRALAVLNPNQPGCEYPCKALCGAGVAFKVAQALLAAHADRLKSSRDGLMLSFAKLAAIATIADAVPLTGENRVLASLGLAGLRDARNPGLKSLMATASLDPSRPVTTTDVAFRLAPRLNAAGRMDVARSVVELFSVRDLDRARELAERLNQLNGDRQQEEQRIVAEVEERLTTDTALAAAFCLVIEGEGWHRGVIGIVATRVVERTGKPALVLARDESGEAHGSGRSIPPFHLLEALESCAELFTRFGGHAHAVGFALPGTSVDELRRRMDAFARSRLTTADFEPVLAIDAELPLAMIGRTLMDSLRQLEPFGMANPEPRFVAHDARLLAPPRVIKEKHLKLRLAQTGSATGSKSKNAVFNAMAWRMAARFAQTPLHAGDAVDVVFRLAENIHPDFGGLELVVLDLRAHKK